MALSQWVTKASVIDSAVTNLSGTVRTNLENRSDIARSYLLFCGVVMNVSKMSMTTNSNGVNAETILVGILRRSRLMRFPEDVTQLCIVT